MNENELKQYAREGARLQMQHILEVFPDLAPVAAPAATSTRRKVTWTPAMRKRHAAMMRKRWAARRK